MKRNRSTVARAIATFSILVTSITTAGYATSSQTAQADKSDDAALAAMMRGESLIQGEELDSALEQAESHPLGSEQNPVRASMPQGQRAYLNRLRCSDLSRPTYQRSGNLGPGVYGNIVDLYIVTCATGEPSSAEVVMDMYHRGYVEDEAVPGFGIVGGRVAE